MITGKWDIDMTPTEELIKALKSASGPIKQSVNRSLKPLRAAVISQAQGLKKRGHLAKSIGNRVKLYRSGNVAGIVGPKMKYLRKRGKYTRGKKQGQPRNIRPYLYAMIISSPKSGRRYRPWLKNAMASAGGVTVRQLRDDVRRQLQELLRRKKAS